MGEATARKVIEIEDTRRQIEVDLRDLEDRLPPPLRSTKALLGLVAASSLLMLLVLRVVRSGKRQPSAEVVVRIVREDR